ncbi:hypothetical protein AWH69_13035 [Janibacter melonis]|uniref:SAF domain-containing protein n=1 Tax=Janibacter melonis TaxID=262209 RepID=A0A176Q9C2_9MICO|nr:SAF domain-containing protein [Janibacter melonis]OAB86275.1 hypothetical protein AWH69_13035 [Janibacter melonis]
MADLLATQLPSLFGPGRRPAWRRRVARRLVAAAALCLALTLALGQQAPEPTRAVLVASAHVPPGTEVLAEAVAVVDLPRSAAPDGALTRPDEAVGRMATVAIGPGEVITPARVLGRDPASAGRGRRLVTLPLLGAARSLTVGDRVDVYRPGRREPVATGATVVAIPSTADDLAAVPEPTAVVSLPVEAAGDVVDALGADAATGFVLTTRGAG